ncbi:MAG: PHP domain-containing protein [Phytoplasma sp.]|uniref:PHP domain-containing protein n=1 Tax=Phytoplasma sp. TaxID=2155 RepID=UPI002B403563|nr:PHP domain-containing protein [Phytoplasma sp.]WRH06622.1 MAG: PHP domain-containing protein [Phytoplasma sp.]
MIGVFYLQSYYSIMESINSIEALIKKAKENNYCFVALSDNENLHGMVEFLYTCQKYKIKPILGIKINLSLNIIIKKNKKIGLLIYALNDIGINNLIRISNLIKTQKQNITLEILKQSQKGLFFILSNIDFVFSEISDLNSIEKIFSQLKDNLDLVFFGLSLQSDNLELFANNILAVLVEKLKISVVVVHKTNFLETSEKEAHNLLLKLMYPSKDFHMSFQFLNQKEIYDKYQSYYDDYKTSFLDLDTFIKSIKYFKIFPSNIGLPKFQQKSQESSTAYLEKITYSSLKEKIPISSSKFSVYTERLKKELKIIKDMHYEDYFLIVFDLMKYARDEGILLGVGRGSSAGSLVCFCLGITEADPLVYNLLFERFLNPKRNKKPDIDLDFPDNKISIILKYIYDKYGSEYTSNIITFNTLTIKSFLRNANYIKYQKEVLKISKPDNKQIKILGQLEGLPQFTGTHPAGIIISNNNLFKHFPVQSNPQSNTPFKYQTQIEAQYLEKIGLPKIDFLSLKSLTLVDKILREINISSKEKINWQQFPLDDNLTYQLLQRGDTEYIFQLESPTAKKVLQKVEPQKIEDLVAVLALNRPGQINYIDYYCRNKKENKNFLVETDIYKYLKDILKNTYGIILYQEQIMETAFTFAGYDFSEAEIFMKYIIKKSDVIDKKTNLIKTEFIKRSERKGHSKKLASRVYDYILKFSNYSFNKSHSVSYSLISYRMAYLKTHYFVIFLKVLLEEYQKVPSETENLLLKIQKKHETKIIIPNIFKSGIQYELSKGKLLLPLTLIRNVSEEIAEFIIKERQIKRFVDFYDFKKRCQKILNNNLLRDLILAGVFNEFGLNKNTLLNESDLEYLEHEEYLLDDKKQIFLEELPKEYLEQEMNKIFGFHLSALLL